MKYELTAVPSPVVYHLHSVLDNHMDLFAIQHMDKDTLAYLVPKLGIRIRFEEKRKQWVSGHS